MKKLFSLMLVLTGILALSCSSDDDGTTSPPSVDKTMLMGEWKQMPFEDDEYYHSLSINKDLSFTGLWSAYDEDIEGYEYTRVSGRIVVDGNTIMLYENFYDEDGEYDETEEFGPLEIVTLTNDILVLREKDYHDGHIIGYYYYGFYREHSADMLPPLAYESLVQDARISIYDANGYNMGSIVSMPYSESSKSLRAKVVLIMQDNKEVALENEYITYTVLNDSYYMQFARDNNEYGKFNVCTYENTSSYSRTARVELTAPYFFMSISPRLTIYITQSGKPTSGGSSGGNTGGSSGGSSGGSTGGNTGGSSGGSSGGSTGGSSSNDNNYVGTVTACEILQVSNNVSITSSSETMYLYKSPTGSYYLKTSKTSSTTYMVTRNVSSYVYSGDHKKKISVSKFDYCAKRYVGISTYYYFFNM
ncbi:MAG: hypothetical protein IJC92_08555 [Bacteroidaceae bacterium]|nr:hypothetical protein [Bacteroidaceae bacterium]